MSAPPTEGNFRLLVEGVSNYAIYMLDPEGRVASWNRGAEQIKQYAAEEILGRHFGEFYPPEARERGEPDHNLQIARERGRFEETAWRLRKDGSRFWAHVLIDPLRDETGALIGFAKVTSDVTERKRTEEALIQAQKMESIGQLSAGIAHDFNNLLTVILGNAELLSDLLKARQDLRHLAQDIEHAGQRGAELTQRLLAFGRRQTLMPVELDCNALVDSMQKLLRRTLREDILIDAEFDANLHAAYADRAQLESAILNLALNAQDAMPSGGRLSIATANVKLDQSYQMINQDVRPGAYVMLALTDNGSGMTAEVLERAFEPFYTTKDAGKGSGLGLSMVYGFVKQSNGHVSIYSEPELGTTVRLYLPAAESYAALSRSEASNERIATTDVSKGEAVLIVEDDADVRSYAVRCLSSLGYTVVAAIDGEDAWQKLTGPTVFDVLFTDVVMPGGLSGWALAEAALARRPDLRVLLTSGYALDSIAGRSRGHNAFPILTKPYHKSELGRRLREVIEAPPPTLGDDNREDPSSHESGGASRPPCNEPLTLRAVGSDETLSGRAAESSLAATTIDPAGARGATPLSAGEGSPARPLHAPRPA